MLVKRKLPSRAVVVSRLKPVTGLLISTAAAATTPPDGSLTTPSIEPELPNWAFATPADNNRTPIAKTANRLSVRGHTTEPEACLIILRLCSPDHRRPRQI